LTFWTVYQNVLNKGRLDKEMKDKKISTCRIKMDKIIATRYRMMKDKWNMTTNNNNRTWTIKKERMTSKAKANTIKMKKIWKSIRIRINNSSNSKTKNNRMLFRNKLIIMMMTNNKATSIKMVKWTNSSNSNLVQMNSN